MNKILQENSETISDDKKISIAVMSSFVLLTIQYFILVYFNMTGTPRANKIQLFSKFIVGIFYLVALPSVLKRNRMVFIGAYVLSIPIFLLNYFLFHENWIYLEETVFPFFFMCIPTLVYSYSINDWDILKNTMRKASLIVFIFGTAIGILVFTKKVSFGAYSMPLSYYMLLPTVVYMDSFLEKPNLKSIFVFLISFFVILAIGARGPVMCMGLYLFIRFINTMKKLDHRKALIILIIVTLLIITTLLFFHDILESIYNFLLNFDINSRSIRLFLEGGIYLSGREKLYKPVLQEIRANPILGIGLAGDRRITKGSYVHNILIEVLANFGMIIGFALLFLLMIISYRILFSEDEKLSNFITIWFSIGVVHLMVSSSYLIDLKFWIFMGLILKFSRNNTHKMVTNA